MRLSNVQDKLQKSVGVSNRLLTCATSFCQDHQGALTATRGWHRKGTHQLTSRIPEKHSGQIHSHRRENPPEKSTQNKKVPLNKFFWTIFVGFLTRVAGKQAKIRANFSKKPVWKPCFFFGLPGFSMGFVRSEEVQNEKAPNFYNFRPEFCSEKCSAWMFPDFFEDFSCFVSFETETMENSPNIPAISQCQIPRQIQRKNSEKFSGEQAEEGFGASMSTYNTRASCCLHTCHACEPSGQSQLMSEPRRCHNHWVSSVRVGFWQTGFFAEFYFWATGFFSGFFRWIFSPHFFWEKVPRKIIQEYTRRNPPNVINKIPRHIWIFCRGASTQ